MTEQHESEALRDEVEKTREHLAETVDELAAKFDVKSRAKESAHEFTNRRRRPSSTRTESRGRRCSRSPPASPALVPGLRWSCGRCAGSS